MIMNHKEIRANKTAIIHEIIPNIKKPPAMSPRSSFFTILTNSSLTSFKNLPNITAGYHIGLDIVIKMSFCLSVIYSLIVSLLETLTSIICFRILAYQKKKLILHLGLLCRDSLLTRNHISFAIPQSSHLRRLLRNLQESIPYLYKVLRTL